MASLHCTGGRGWAPRRFPPIPSHPPGRPSSPHSASCAGLILFRRGGTASTKTAAPTMAMRVAIISSIGGLRPGHPWGSSREGPRGHRGGARPRVGELQGGAQGSPTGSGLFLRGDQGNAKRKGYSKLVASPLTTGSPQSFFGAYPLEATMAWRLPCIRPTTLWTKARGNPFAALRRRAR